MSIRSKAVVGAIFIALIGAGAGAIVVSSSMADAVQSPTGQARSGHRAFGESAILKATSKAFRENLLDPQTGQDGTSDFQAWITRRIATEVTISPLTADVRGHADCGKENITGIEAVTTRPAGPSSNPDIASRTEVVVDLCSPLGGFVYRLDEAGLKATVGLMIGGPAAKALGVSRRRVGPVKNIALAPHRRRAKISYANDGRGSLKSITAVRSKVEPSYYGKR